MDALQQAQQLRQARANLAVLIAHTPKLTDALQAREGVLTDLVHEARSGPTDIQAIWHAQERREESRVVLMLHERDVEALQALTLELAIVPEELKTLD